MHMTEVCSVFIFKIFIYIYCVWPISLVFCLFVCLSFIYVPIQIYGDFTISGQELQNLDIFPALSVLG